MGMGMGGVAGIYFIFILFYKYSSYILTSWKLKMASIFCFYFIWPGIYFIYLFIIKKILQDEFSSYFCIAENWNCLQFSATSDIYLYFIFLILIFICNFISL